MSYFTPPPTAGTGSPWTPSAHSGPSAAVHMNGHPMHPPGPPLPPASPANAQQQPNVNHMFAMYATMMQQQMQNLPHNNLPPQYAQPQPPTPVVEPQNLRTPQSSDNNLIAQILYEQTKRGLTYKGALESLHGHNGIAAFAWKDYYLEHKQLIDDLVNKLRTRVSLVPNVKPEPRSSSSIMVDNLVRDSHENENKKRHPQTQPRAQSLSRKGKVKEATPVPRVKKEKDMNGKKVKVQDFEPDSASRRRTLNSLSSTPSLGLLASVPPGVPIDSHTGLPASPSRSPSPPVAAPGQKYTDDDAVFFFKRIAYDLSRNPEHNKASLCDMLAKKAPHHSALSWKTYWIRHEDVADKMLLLTQLDDQDREEVIRSWKTGISVTANGTGNQSRKQAKKVNYQENSESGSGSDSESDGSESAYSEEASNDEDEDGDDAVGSTDDDEELGVAGSPFTTAECRVLAKHIATVPDWFRGYKEWDDFTSTYTQRTPASWKEFYRRRSKDVDALAKKYIKRAKKQQTVAAQRGRPSWARRGSSKPSMSSVGDSASTKRRYSSSEERERSEEKRAKMNELDIY